MLAQAVNLGFQLGQRRRSGWRLREFGFQCRPLLVVPSARRHRVFEFGELGVQFARQAQCADVVVGLGCRGHVARLCSDGLLQRQDALATRLGGGRESQLGPRFLKRCPLLLQLSELILEIFYLDVQRLFQLQGLDKFLFGRRAVHLR